jgi:sugar lactone lactonase YvrE
MFTSRLLCAALLMSPCAFPVDTRTWLHGTQADFEEGTLEKLSLRSDGMLTLAPVFRELYDASTAYLWALAEDSKGNLYTGGGGPSASAAKVFAIDSSGKARTLAELPGLQIQAIAVDRRDRVYAATTPDGKVYRIEDNGKFDVFYDPKAKYIWAMAFSSKGDLYIATGDGGEIHRVTADGKGSVFFRTEETHARSLAIDAKDNIVVGTEPGGLILRISPAGEGFVLYQSSKREVTSVAVGSDGAIYAAAAGNKTPPGSPPSLSVPVPVQPVPSGGPSGGSGAQTQRGPIPVAPVQAAPAAPPSPSVSGGSEVYRIGVDNFPQKVWSHPQDVVYAIGFDPAGRPVAGTGNKGSIYRIDSELVSTLMINAAPTQVTAFAIGRRGRLYAATGNVGKVFQIGPEIEKTGSYESQPLDGAFFSYWGRIRHKSDLNGGAVRFETRSGNLDRPQKNWSPWVGLNAGLDPAAARIGSPSGRFLQYRVNLSAAPDGKSPQVREIEVAYMAKNVAPVVEEIDITPANYRFPQPGPPGAAVPPTMMLPPLGQRRRTAPVSMDTVSTSQSMQYAKGSAGVRWAVNDPNGDPLIFKVEIRGEQEREWKLLKDEVRERFLSWDSTAFPDGEYTIRITASDRPGNPVDQALSTQLETERFSVDNTPPQIANLAATGSGNSITVRWKAHDAKSTIQRAEYSVNGGEWIVVQPTTRLSDSPAHEYLLTVPSKAPEETIAVRVTDQYDNFSVEKVIVR